MISRRATRPTPPSRNPERRSFALMNSASDFRHARQVFHMPLRGPCWRLQGRPPDQLNWGDGRSGIGTPETIDLTCPMVGFLGPG